MRTSALRLWLALLASMIAPAAWAGGPFGIDHRVTYDNSGIWARSIQTDLAIGTAVSVIGGAVWLGDDDPLGDTLWRSVDAMAFTAVTVEAMKFTFSRERPSQTSDPNQFFAGRGNQSFPSGEVAEIASAVTPIMLAYGPDHPWVYGLAALPLYDAIARVKVHGHWQSDVLVGGAIGVGFGIYASHRDSPLSVGLLPRGLTIGISKRF
jgi:undecaprenyl-diphosphatase